MTLPAPDSVVSRARQTESASTGPAVNVAITGSIDADAVERTEGGYAGETAGVVGRLAAAVAVAEDAAVHYPDPILTADGPWLVLAPLSGLVSTVATGRGRLTVVLDVGGEALDRLDDRLSTLLDAARPSHDHYPVDEDSRGVFTTGMTTFALDSVSVDGRVTVTFDVSTTPATRPTEVESRFAGVAGVVSATYETVVGVERGHPSSEFRDAVEAAHRDGVGDCEYGWLRSPDTFAAIPAAEKMALGTGEPDATEFTAAQYETCVALLESVLSDREVLA